MSKKSFFLSLLLVISIATLPAIAGAEEATAGEEGPDAVASLPTTPDWMRGVDTAPGVALPDPGVGGQDPVPVHTGCQAHKNCSGGCHLSCNGSSSCSVGTDHVNCDGNKTYCNTCCTYGACTGESDCDPPSGVCAPDIGRCMSSGCCICA